MLSVYTSIMLPSVVQNTFNFYPWQSGTCSLEHYLSFSGKYSVILARTIYLHLSVCQCL